MKDITNLGPGDLMIHTGIERIKRRYYNWGIPYYKWSRVDIDSYGLPTSIGFNTGPMSWRYTFNNGNVTKELVPAADYLSVILDSLPPDGELYIATHELGHIEHQLSKYEKSLGELFWQNKDFSIRKIKKYRCELDAVFTSVKIFKEEDIPIQKSAAVKWWIGSLERYAEILFGGKFPNGLLTPDEVSEKIGLKKTRSFRQSRPRRLISTTSDVGATSNQPQSSSNAAFPLLLQVPYHQQPANNQDQLTLV
jgi:hypothetical protein